MFRGNQCVLAAIDGFDEVPVELENQRDSIRRIVIVVNDQNTSGIRAFSTCPWILRDFGLLFGERQTDDKLAAVAESLAVSGHCAAMHLHQLPDQSQSDSQSPFELSPKTNRADRTARGYV